MKNSVAIVGLVILLVGVIGLAYGWTNPLTTETTHSNTVNLTVVPSTTRTIDAGGTWEHAVNLQAGEVVTGTYAITDYASSQGPAFLYVQNEVQFRNWVGCQPCSSPSLANYTVTATPQTFTWTVQQTGPYYFVFDVENYGKSATATFSTAGTMTTDVTVTTTSPNMTVLYAGAALDILGALVLAAGLVKGSTKRT